MKNLKARSGITLIALVITIIVLIILAGVAINLTLGQNGLLNRTKEAREKYEIASAKEYIELKIDECIIEKGGEASLQDIIDYLAEDSNVTYYVALEEVGLVAGEVDIGSPKEIYVVYNSYQFKINESKKVEFISIVDVDLEGKVSIEAQVKEHLGKNADEKYEARVLLKATGDAEISKLEIQNPDGTSLTLEPDGLTTVGKDMTIEFDKTYKVILTTAKGHRYTKKIIEKSEETIMNAEQLASFRDRVNSGLTYEGKTVKLGADIDLSTVCGANVGGKEVSWEPIGTETISFKGTFDGSYYAINNLYINSDKYAFAGLFRNNEGIIQNTIMNNVNIYNYSNSNISIYCGAIVAYNNKIVRNCGINTGNVNAYNVTPTTSGWRQVTVGGIAGNSIDKIQNCFNKASVRGETYNSNYTSAYVGGIVGTSGHVTIENSYNVGNVYSNKGATGGIDGVTGMQSTEYKFIINCYNTGNINAAASYNAGIVGTATKYVTINNCYYTNGNAYNTVSAYGNPTTTNVSKVSTSTLQGYATILGDAFTNDIKEKVVDETTGEEKEVWKYNNGYPILKWQLQENQVAE